LIYKIKRPHMFIKELNLYIDYLQNDLQSQLIDLTEKKKKQLSKFKLQLQDGIAYYKELFAGSVNETSDMLQDWINDLSTSEEHLSRIAIA
jgi:DNA-directed RNA polymerase